MFKNYVQGFYSLIAIYFLLEIILGNFGIFFHHSQEEKETLYVVIFISVSVSVILRQIHVLGEKLDRLDKEEE